MEHARRKLLSILGLVPAGVAFATTARARDGAKPTDDLADLHPGRSAPQGSRRLQGKNKDNANDVATLSRIDPLVGTVMAFTERRGHQETQEGDWSEREIGWLKCDGRSFFQIGQELGLNDSDLGPIKLVLSGDSIPDYQGYFLRGIDRKVADRTQRRRPGR